MRLVLVLMCLCMTTVAAQAPPRSDTIVKLAGPPRHAGGGHLVEEFSLGSDDRGPNYQFIGISALLPARDGSVWVLDGWYSALGALASKIAGSASGGGPGMTLRRFDASGQFLKTVAVSGQGPGELFSPSAITQLPDGRVLLREKITGEENILVYSEAGSFLTTWRWPRVQNGSHGTGWMVSDATGMTHAVVLLRDTADPANTAIAYRSAIARIDSAGKFVDLIPPPPQLSLPVGGGRGNSQTGGAGVHPIWSPLGHMVTASAERYALDLWIPRTSAAASASRAPLTPPAWREGDPIVSIRRNTPVIRISAAELRDREALAQTGARTQAVTKPPIRALKAGADGRLWVQVSAPSERHDPTPVTNSQGAAQSVFPWREPQVYDVFEPDGAYVGQLRAPDAVQLMFTRGDSAWGTQWNLDGVPIVKRWRIEWR